MVGWLVSTGLHLAEGQLIAHGELRKHVEILQELFLAPLAPQALETGDFGIVEPIL